ncbi:MAG TPA: hypothetical protein VK992_04260 [Candidatus Caenarcaniphilales bacterium]|nr:hypothetical protein [Candidatus Caenarcaniphilales bacterium]
MPGRLNAFLRLRLNVPTQANLDVVCCFWCPPEGIAERSWRDGVPYADWARDGFLIATEGNVTDYDVAREGIRELAGEYQIEEIGFDRWNATQLITQLGGDGATCVPISQGFAELSAPSKELEPRASVYDERGLLEL